MNFIQLLQDNYIHLTKSEKKVADYILAIGEKIIYSTMHDIKDKTKVGDATIIRFCQKLGFSGFSELKISIAKEGFPKTLEKKEGFFDELVDDLSDVLKRTRELLNEKELERAVNLITKARHVYCYGVGASGNTAEVLEKMFLRVGVHAHAIRDPHYQAQSSSLLTEKDVIIAFSLSGKTRDTFESVQLAKENKAQVISVTNYLSSPIAQQGDVVLQTVVEEFFDGGSLAGSMSQLYLCEVLVKSYEFSNQIDPLELREKVIRSVIDKSV